MDDSLSYPPSDHYIAGSYYETIHPASHHQVQITAPPSPRAETTQRKRPKYTRSKTGCLTCRVKKIKCDETKPSCMRCMHGTRECTWPEGVPVRKRPVKNDPDHTTLEMRPSTAESSGHSETSRTPPSRDLTPPLRGPVPDELGLPPMVSRRQSEPYIHSMVQAPDSRRRMSIASSVGRGSPGSLYPNVHHSTTNGGVMSLIPEIASYPPQPRYDLQRYDQPCYDQPRYDQPRYEHGYSNGIQSVPAMSPSRPAFHSAPVGIRPMNHHPVQTQWNQPMMSAGMDPMEPYFSGVQERMVGLSHGHHARYE